MKLAKGWPLPRADLDAIAKRKGITSQLMVNGDRKFILYRIPGHADVELDVPNRDEGPGGFFDREIEAIRNSPNE
jgi:hypothetical protein